MEIAVVDAFIIFFVGLAAGIINTVAGGGSLLTLPVMIFLGLPSHIANATNRVAIFAQNIFSVAGFQSKGVSAFPYAFWLSGSSFIGALIGAKFAIDINPEIFNRVLAVVMLVVLFITIMQPKNKGEVVEKMTLKSKTIGTMVFFFIGIYGGFLQAGIGFIMIAALTSINGFGLAKTNSVKVFVALVYTVAALGVFIYEDAINWSYGLFLALGNALGGWVMSRWSVDKGDRVIRIILIVAVAVMSVKLWFF